MTEAEWLAATELTPMLAFLREKASDRKLRLFGLDCCRLVSTFLDPRGLKAVDAAERYADALCSPEELEAARLAANEAFCEFSFVYVDHIYKISVKVRNENGCEIPDTRYKIPDTDFCLYKIFQFSYNATILYPVSGIRYLVSCIYATIL